MSEMNQLEEQIAQAKVAKAQLDKVFKLCGNREFQELVVDGFMRDECARYTHMSTDTAIPLEDRQDSLGYAQAAGYLKRWINLLITMGENATRDLPQMEELRSQLRQAEAE